MHRVNASEVITAVKEKHGTMHSDWRRTLCPCAVQMLTLEERCLVNSPETSGHTNPPLPRGLAGGRGTKDRMK